MKYYKISEERLKELLYTYYKLDCLEINGVDNWPGYMDNKIQYVNEALGVYNEDDWDEDADLSDMVEKDLAEYEEIIEKID